MHGVPAAGLTLDPTIKIRALRLLPRPHDHVGHVGERGSLSMADLMPAAFPQAWLHLCSIADDERARREPLASIATIT